MTRVVATLAMIVALWAIDPVIAHAMQRSPELVAFGLSPWVWIVVVGGGVALAFLAALSVLACIFVGVRDRGEGGQ